MTPFLDPAVADKFNAYPPGVRRKMLALRELVLRTAASTPGAGEIQETLKWGEPAYLTKNKTASTVRMDWKANDPNHYAIYFNCQTNLIETFRMLFPRELQFEGNRALLFEVGGTVPEDAVAMCVAASLTYHARKKTSRLQGRGRK
jgi:hypothetical protein